MDDVIDENFKHSTYIALNCFYTYIALNCFYMNNLCRQLKVIVIYTY